MYTRPTAPRSIGGVIDDAIKLYMAAFGACLVPALIGALLIAVSGGWLQLWLLQAGARPTPAQMLAIFAAPTVWIAYGGLIVVSVWSSFAIVGALIRVARGEKPTVGETLGTSLRVFPTALFGTIISLIALMIGLVLLIIPGLFLAGRWMYWGVSLMEERGSALDAIGRSWQLSKGNWWRGIGILTVVGILVIVLSMVGSFCVGIVMGFAHADRTTLIIVTQALQGIVHVFIAAASPAALVSIYFDLQLRREGGDLAARVGNLA